MAVADRKSLVTRQFDMVERVLENGLRVLMLPVPSASLVVCDLHYAVGAFDEPPGLTGLAHYVEHMLFKGTPRYPKGEIDRLVALAAGQSNAETGDDSTHYWFVFPNDRWELALAVEADRMREALFDAAEVEFERQVIAEERARELSTAWGRLDQKHSLFSYVRHPYRNPILGWPDDMARIGVSELKAFYDRHYRPGRAVLVVAGDIDPDDVLEKVRMHFGGLRSRGSSPPKSFRHEPRPRKRRDFVMVEEEAAHRAILGWHTVGRGHKDAVALDVLSDMLGSGRPSRLWQTLVETDRLATWVEVFHGTAQRAGQFLIQIEAVPGTEPATIERRISEELKRMAELGPTTDELARSASRLDAAWRWEREDLVSLAASLGSAALFGDWRNWFLEHQAALAVTGDDIRGVASKYFDNKRLTTGWSLPYRKIATTDHSLVSERPLDLKEGRRRTSASIGGTEIGVSTHENPMGPTTPEIWAVGSAVSRLKEYAPRRQVLENGLTLIYEHRPGVGLIALEMYHDCGVVREAKPGLAYFTGRLREEGTTTRSARQLAKAIEDSGGSFETRSTGSSFRARAEDLPLALEILADLTIRPAFPADASAWVLERIGSELKADLDDPAFLADLTFHAMIYGGHPLGRDPRGSARDLERLDRTDAMAHHGRHVRPETSILVAVGDFEPRRLLRLISQWFAPWPRTGQSQRPLPRVPKPGPPSVRRIARAGDQVQIEMGHLGIARRHRDFDSLLVLDHMLGSGPGFTDRLGKTLREELGLVYSVSGGMTDSADLLPGVFRIAAATSPDETERVVGTITKIVEEMSTGAFADDEVERARRYLAGAWVFDYQGIEQRAERLLDLERWGMRLGDPLEWPDRIDSITPADVRRAARLHLHPDGMTRVEIGPLT